MDIQTASRAVPLPSAELNLGGTSTSETQFKTASAQNGVAAASTLVCYTPGSNELKNRPFRVRAGGRFTTGTTTVLTTVNLYWGTSSTIGSNVKIASVSANPATAKSGTWFIDCTLSWDSTSAAIQGTQEGYMLGSPVARTNLTTSTSSVDLSGESTSNGFSITGTFGTGNASNVLYVDTFEVLTN